jgi:hypothetical protein
MRKGRCLFLVIIAEGRVAKDQRIINNKLPMTTLLLTFALAEVVSAGGASRAFAFLALAYNDATGVAGWNGSNSTLEGLTIMPHCTSTVIGIND